MFNLKYLMYALIYVIILTYIFYFVNIFIKIFVIFRIYDIYSNSTLIVPPQAIPNLAAFELDKS